MTTLSPPFARLPRHQNWGVSSAATAMEWNKDQNSLFLACVQLFVCPTSPFSSSYSVTVKCTAASFTMPLRASVTCQHVQPTPEHRERVSSSMGTSAASRGHPTALRERIISYTLMLDISKKCWKLEFKENSLEKDERNWVTVFMEDEERKDFHIHGSSCLFPEFFPTYPPKKGFAKKVAFSIKITSSDSLS